MQTGLPLAHLTVRAHADGVHVAVGDGTGPQVSGRATQPPGWPHEPLAVQRLLASVPPVWDRLQRLRGRAEAVARPLVIVVDSDVDAPWEHLALSEVPLHVDRIGLVVRLGDGVPAPVRVEPTGAVVGHGELREVAGTALDASGLRRVPLASGPTMLWISDRHVEGVEAPVILSPQGTAGRAALHVQLPERYASVGYAAFADAVRSGVPL